MKKKNLFIMMGVTISLLVSGCSSGIPQEEYDALEAEAESIRAERDSLRKELDSIKVAKSDLQKNFNIMEYEYKSYKASMAAYEDLAKADSESAAAKKEAEEAMGYETGITYDQLARNPEDYDGSKVKFTGKVLQVIESTSKYIRQNQIRLAVDNDSSQVVLIEYDADLVNSRILEGDIITIYGTSRGIKTYTSTLRKSISVPKVYVAEIEQ